MQSKNRAVYLQDMAALLVKGAGGPVDAAAAVPRLQALCDKPFGSDDPAMDINATSIACRMLSNLYQNGLGVEKDAAKAKSLMKRA